MQSAAVNVICELARKNPKNYLSLAPLFFKLMTTSTNNWVLIKIIKLVSVALFILSGVNILSGLCVITAYCATSTCYDYLTVSYVLCIKQVDNFVSHY